MGRQIGPLLFELEQWPHIPTFFIFCINGIPVNPATKTVKAHVYLTTNPTAFLTKLKISPITFPSMTRNASAAFPTSPFWKSACLINQFFKVPSPFGELKAVGIHPKTSVTATIILEIVIERAVSIDAILIHCSQNKVRILSAKDAF